jgi:hypothetical protein
MNLQTLKKDEGGVPIYAKLCIAILGNLEENIWSKSALMPQ